MGSVGKVFYRAILRWAKQAEGVPFVVRHSDVTELCPRHLRPPALFEDSRCIVALARAAFQEGKSLQDDAAAEALDNGLEAVRRLHVEYQAILEKLRQTRRDRNDRTNVLYSVGQVFEHKKYGYKGVVYGWDRQCDRDEDWAALMNVDPKQPFYSVLPDEHDCVRLFGSPRLSKYVAQVNMEPCTKRVHHRAIQNFFDGYSDELGRYIPVRRLQYEYPDVYSADDDPQDVSFDANVLAHPDQLEGSVSVEDSSDRSRVLKSVYTSDSSVTTP